MDSRSVLNLPYDIDAFHIGLPFRYTFFSRPMQAGAKHPRLILTRLSLKLPLISPQNLSTYFPKRK